MQRFQDAHVVVTAEGEEMAHSDQKSAESQDFDYDADLCWGVHLVATKVAVDEQRDHVEGGGEGVGQGETQADYEGWGLRVADPERADEDFDVDYGGDGAEDHQWRDAVCVVLASLQIFAKFLMQISLKHRGIKTSTNVYLKQHRAKKIEFV